MLFLQILAAVFFSMLLIVALLYFWLKWRLRRAFKDLGESMKEMGEAMEALKSGSPPDRVHLRRLDADTFADPAKERAMADALLGEGFTDLGYYSIEEIPAVKMRALMNVEQAVYAAVCELEPVGVFLDLVCQYPDGTSYTYSTSPETGLEKPPGKTSVKVPDADAASLYRRLIAERKGGPFVPVSAEAFAPAFEKEYADEQDWRNSRGGLSEGEIRRIAAKSGPVDEHTIELTRMIESARAAAATDKAVRERFYASAGWSQQQQEEQGEALTIVHERTDEDALVEAYFSALNADEEGDRDQEGDDDDEGDEKTDPREDEARLVIGANPPRRAFELLNAKLPVERRYKKVGEVTQPVGADVYQAPWQIDE